MGQRFIDANAFSNALNRRYGEAIEKKSFEEAKGIEIAIRMLSIATTVETTDDVLARLPEGYSMVREGDTYLIGGYGCAQNEVYFEEICGGKTPLEAVKRLEESLNRK